MNIEVEYDSTKVGIQQETHTTSKTNWKSILNDRQKDPILFELMKKTEEEYIQKKENSVLREDSMVLSIMIQEFLSLLKSKKLSSTFPYSPAEQKCVEGEKKKVDKKNKKKMEMLKKIEEDRAKKMTSDIHDRIFSIQLKDNIPYIKSNKFDLFFTLLYWACHLLKKEDYITIEFYRCVISFYHSLQQMKPFFDESFIDSCYTVLQSLEEKMKKQKGQHYYETLFRNEHLFIENFWSANVEFGIDLYPEQKKVIEITMEALQKDEPLLLMYKLPPSQGKTVLAAPLSRMISHLFPNKIFLYICYSDIVRMDVAKLANSQGVDLHFWMAKTHYDVVENRHVTLFDPFKKCYKKWDQKTLRNPNERKKFQEKREKERHLRENQDLKIQMEYYQRETIREYPEMIIADPESARRIIEEFGDMMVCYYDEPTATADNPVTSHIMSILPKTSILVSATLPELEEIPILCAHLKQKNAEGREDDSYFKVVSSNKQHIGCCFVDPYGCVYLPHHSMDDFDKMDVFLQKLKKDPLKLRSYIPESVFEMSQALKPMCPADAFLHFEERFQYLGDIHYESIRQYAIELLQFIWDRKEERLLRRIQEIRTQKLTNMDPITLLTSNSLFYKEGNALHIATESGFQEHIRHMAEPLLESSPDNMNSIESYCQSQLEAIRTERERIEKYAALDKDSVDMDRRMLEERMSNIRIGWPSEFLVNSKSHASRFGNVLAESKAKMILDPEEFVHINRLLDPFILKLMLCGVGVYHPENGDETLKQLFLQNIAKYHISLSTPAIIYGANMAIQCIDFDASYTEEATRNTIYQAIGRAGRGGGRCMKEAMAIFRDFSLLDKAMNVDSVNIEARILEQKVYEIISLSI
jgi:hypothetical protein